MKERKTGIGRRKFYIAYGSNLDMDQMRKNGEELKMTDYGQYLLTIQ